MARGSLVGPFTCRVPGCGYVADNGGKMRSHVKTAHPEEYERRREERAQRRAERGAAAEGPAAEVETRSVAELETELLGETATWFEQQGLPAEVNARVLAYLAARFADGLLQLNREALLERALAFSNGPAIAVGIPPALAGS